MNDLAYSNLEIIIVISVVGIIFKILPLPLKTYDQVKQNMDLEMLIEDINHIGNKSNLENSIISIDLQKDRYIIRYSEGTKPRKVEKLYTSGLRLRSNNFENKEIKFTNGSSNAGTLEVVLNGKLRKITIPPVYSSVNLKEVL